mmetsp:Transcript_27437/g.52255  ORF Transcript_27437/g.52255 Transcript_27437/m.52255 type:complete len:205 (+) Transcript_27437:1088-1702(+)
MQKGCDMIRVMCCSWNTCSAADNTAALRIRLSAYCRPVFLSVTRRTSPFDPPPRIAPSVRVTTMLDPEDAEFPTRRLSPALPLHTVCTGPRRGSVCFSTTDTFLCFSSPESSVMRFFVIACDFSRSMSSCRGPSRSMKDWRDRHKHLRGSFPATMTLAIRGSSVKSARSPKKSARNKWLTFSCTVRPRSSVLLTTTSHSPSMMI